MDKGPDAFRTISEVADELDVPQHVLRFWETRFAQIKPLKRGGGRRFYRPDDVELIRGIRHLLYGEGYTIKGVQRILKEEGVRFVQSAWRAEAVSLPQREAVELDDFELDDLVPDEEPEPARPPGPAVARREPTLAAPPPVSASPVRRDPAPGRPEQQAFDDLWFDQPAGVAIGEEDGDGPMAAPPMSGQFVPDITQAMPERGIVRSGPVGPENQPALPALRPDARGRLEEALDELMECRRLLAQVRSNPGAEGDE